MVNSERYLLADWPAPDNVHALVTTRKNGFSFASYNSFNLAEHVGDNSTNVQQNRACLQFELELKNSPLWLKQTHGIDCVKWQLNKNITADASFTDCKYQACAVMTADCLPILLTNRQGNWVAACHAGWRGLAGGVIESCVNQYGGINSELMAWIGPAISQKYFEVGDDVREIFIQRNKKYHSFFIKKNNAYYQFDFIALAKSILTELRVETFGGQLCSFSGIQDFYSYRRDGETGRMASLIWFE